MVVTTNNNIKESMVECQRLDLGDPIFCYKLEKEYNDGDSVFLLDTDMEKANKILNNVCLMCLLHDLARVVDGIREDIESLKG